MTSDEPQDPRVGTLLGNFRIVRRLGEGGMGLVYEARHDKIGRRAAVKVLHAEYAESPEYAERFLNEARSVNIAAHPGLVEIFEYGQQSDGALYIVMEFLDGQTLYSRMQAQKLLPPRQVAAIALQIARALATAHDNGIVHRDLKPENVMLIQDPVQPTQERVKVLDFGIAKVNAGQRRAPGATGQEGETRSGAFLGTPLYMSPEQHGSAESVDGRADVFSLGVVMYELLSGRPPYRGNSISLLKRKPPEIGELNPAVPPALQALVERMMAVTPDQRPRMAEVATALEPLAGSLGRRRRGPARRWLIGAAAALVLVAGGLLLYRALRPRSLAEARERALLVVREALLADAISTRVQAVRALGQSRDYDLRTIVEPMLADQDPGVNVAAVRALGQLGDAGAQPALLAALARAREPATRLELATALAQLHVPRGTVLLHELIESGDEANQLATALALADQGDLTGAPPLRQYLDRSPGTEGPTARVLAALARLGDDEARGRLLGLLQGAQNQPLQAQAAWSLARLGDESAHGHLSRLAERRGPQQVLAARLLASLGDASAYPLLATVSTDDKKPDAAREFALEGLGDCGRLEAVPKLLAVLDERGGTPRLRLAAAGAILQLAAGEAAQQAERSLSWARSALGEGGALERELAVAVLGDSDSESALLDLRRALKDREHGVRRSAIHALARKPSRSALAALAEALHDADPQLRTATAGAMARVAKALQEAGDHEAERTARQQLAQQLSAADELTRTGASAALSQLGDRGQGARLLAALGSADPQVRRLAAESLEPGDQENAGLTASLKDANEGVRLAAARKMAGTGNPQALATLSELAGRSDSIGLRAFAQLRKLGRPAPFPARLAELSSASVPERTAVVESAAELPVDDARRVLAAATTDGAASIRRRAAELLASLAHRSATAETVDLLRILGHDPELAVRSRASELLRKLPPLPAKSLGKPDAYAPPERRDTTSRDKPAGGFVLLQGDDGVRVQVDREPAQSLSSKPLLVSVGRHRIGYLGGSAEVNIAEGATVTVRIPVSLLEQLVADAAEAIRGKEYGRAQSLLDRARRVLLRSGGKPAVQAELTYQQGRLDEARGQFQEAMTLYNRYVKLPAAQQKPESRVAVRAAVARLAPHMGLIQIHSLRDGKCKVTDEYYLPPGEHIISLGGGRSKTVRAQAGVITPVKQCP